MTNSRGKKSPPKKVINVQAPLARSSRAPATKKVSTARRQSAETHLFEWKESWRDEYLKWLCGFANAHQLQGRVPHSLGQHEAAAHGQRSLDIPPA